MSKRFTESAKWTDRWFRTLAPELKFGWLYLLDTCDAAGVVEVDPELAEFQIGLKVDWESLFKACGSRIEAIGKGKHWLSGFIKYQYGSLSADCRAHKPVFASLAKHSLTDRVLNGYSEASLSLKDKDKDKDKEQDKDSGGGCKGEAAKAPEVPELICGSKRLSEFATKWLAYKRERRESYRPTGLQAFLTRLENVATEKGPQTVIDKIDRAMASGWVGWEHDEPTSRGRDPADPRGNLALRDKLLAKNREAENAQ